MTGFSQRSDDCVQSSREDQPTSCASLSGKKLILAATFQMELKGPEARDKLRESLPFTQ